MSECTLSRNEIWQYSIEIDNLKLRHKNCVQI